MHLPPTSANILRNSSSEERTSSPSFTSSNPPSYLNAAYDCTDDEDSSEEINQRHATSSRSPHRNHGRHGGPRHLRPQPDPSRYDPNNPVNMYMRPPRGINLIWRNLIYQITPSSWMPCTKSSETKTIIKGLSGHIKSGQLMAIMGPSGAGKSTLLECLAGRRTAGLSGDILVSRVRGLRVSFISQQDFHLKQLTVKETFIYASKIKNCKRKSRYIEQDLPGPPDYGINRIQNIAYDAFQPMGRKDGDVPGTAETYQYPFDYEAAAPVRRPRKLTYHETVALNVIQQLGLQKCADTRVAYCSGGQQKRVSIGVELVSKPHIMILDEPTSGLDSSSCFQCIQLLSDLAKNPLQPIAIMATIHQPSARVLHLFERLYVISFNGYCIYDGTTAGLLPHLKSRGLNCPQYHNPADFITEIASGDHGREAIDRLASYEKYRSSKTSVQEALFGDPSLRPLRKTMNNRRSFPWFTHVWLLSCRSMLTTIREPFLTSLRFLIHVFVALLVSLLYGSKIGTEDGCFMTPESQAAAAFAASTSRFADPTDPTARVQHSENSSNLNSFGHELRQRESLLNSNITFLFFCLLFILFASMMPTALTFPLEMAVFLKEKVNGWYSTSSYFVAKTLADAPLQFLFPILYVVMVYLMTGQVWSAWRFGTFALISIVIAFICQSLGLLVGAIFVDRVDSAVFVAPLSCIPTLLFSGFFVKVAAMPAYLQPFSYFSFFRFGFECLIIGIYGHQRCTNRNSTFDEIAASSSGLYPVRIKLNRFINNNSPTRSDQGTIGRPEDDVPPASRDYEDENVNYTVPRLPSLESFPTPPPGSQIDFSNYPPGQGNSHVPSSSSDDLSSTALDTITLEYESKPLELFELQDDTLITNIIVLVGFLIIFRLIAFLIFWRKSNQTR